jgi:hypothetical protein
MTKTAKMVVAFVIGFLAGWLVGCTGSEVEGETMEIRVFNHSHESIDNLWLGAGSGHGGDPTLSLGAIPAGGMTEYHTVPNHYGSYGIINLVVDGQRHWLHVFTNDEIGRRHLPTRSYTYQIEFVEDSATLLVLPMADAGKDYFALDEEETSPFYGVPSCPLGSVAPPCLPRN